MTLHQKSIAEIESRPEVYVPTEDEKSRGKWAVVHEKLDSDGYPDTSSTPHIIPTYGPHHQISCLCWCFPKLVTKDGVVSCAHEAPQ